ncbi:MAG: protein phosphatase 2C domain-containing protein [Myxococcota bacterium]
MFACSEAGLREAQEDAFVTTSRCLAVADGMGGYDGGADAARVAVRAVAGELEEDDDLEAAFVWASRQVREQGGGGTTLVVARLSVDGLELHAAIAWVGDSRAYRIRGGEAECLTEDHVGSDGGLTRWLPDEPRVDTTDVRLRAGDLLVLLTDGISAVIEDQIADAADAEDPAEWLVVQALEAGSSDNCTAVVCRL